MSTKVNHVQKRITMNRTDIIRYQLMTHCFVRGLSISETALACITLLAEQGEQYLNEFCNRHFRQLDCKSPQVVRNALNSAEQLGIVIKIGKNKKKIFVNPELQLQTSAPVLMDIKILYRESQEST